jgi:enterochelin esterase-like enzyme
MQRMKSRSLIALFVLIGSASSVHAQRFNRTPTPNDTLTSVRIDESGVVTFHIYAPNAEKVTVLGDIGFENFKDLTRGDAGVWSASTSPLEPGAYRYSFTVDGVSVADPRNPIVRENRAMLEVYGEGSGFWTTRDVPHGDLRTVWYPSSTTQATRRMHVYTPPGYDKSTDALPVLYLIHGGGDNDTAWRTVGKANFILDNLLADGRIEPMLVVMPDGSIPVEVFRDDLVKDIIPHVENKYRVLADPEHRALAGLSMGGLEVLDVFMAYPEMFTYINVMSSGWFADNEEMFEAGDRRLAEIATTLNSTVKYLLFTQGGPEDIAYNNCKEMLKLFDKHNINYEFSETPGGHSWIVWRHDLFHFTQALFK